MTPLENIEQTRAIEGCVFYENLRPNQQLDVIAYGALLQNHLKTCILRVFFHLNLASKGDQNTIYLFQSSN